MSEDNVFWNPIEYDPSQQTVRPKCDCDPSLNYQLFINSPDATMDEFHSAFGRFIEENKYPVWMIHDLVKINKVDYYIEKYDPYSEYDYGRFVKTVCLELIEVSRSEMEYEMLFHGFKHRLWSAGYQDVLIYLMTEEISYEEVKEKFETLYNDQQSTTDAINNQENILDGNSFLTPEIGSDIELNSEAEEFLRGFENP